MVTIDLGLLGGRGKLALVQVSSATTRSPAPRGAGPSRVVAAVVLVRFSGFGAARRFSDHPDWRCTLRGARVYVFRDGFRGWPSLAGGPVAVANCMDMDQRTSLIPLGFGQVQGVVLSPCVFVAVMSTISRVVRDSGLGWRGCPDGMDTSTWRVASRSDTLMIAGMFFDFDYILMVLRPGPQPRRPRRWSGRPL